MNTPDNQNPTTRTSTAQIGEKGEAIYWGVTKEAADTDPYNNLAGWYQQAVLRLAAIAASLTSADKAEREKAKRTVRELVKLGKGK